MGLQSTTRNINGLVMCSADIKTTQLNYNDMKTDIVGTPEGVGTKALHIGGVSGSLLKSLHQDLIGFQEMQFLTPDVKTGLGIAIEQVERYMRDDLEAREQ